MEVERQLMERSISWRVDALLDGRPRAVADLISSRLKD